MQHQNGEVESYRDNSIDSICLRGYHRDLEYKENCFSISVTNIAPFKSFSWN